MQIRYTRRPKMLCVHLSTLATILTCSVSAFSPHAFLAGQTILPQRLPTSHLAASIIPATPSTTPEVFFQSRIAEPVDVESVPSAASLLSSTFPEEPFVVEYRQKSIYDVDIERRPVLDLSVLKKIKIDDSDNFVTIDAGVTVGRLVTELTRLSPSSELKELFTALPAGSRLSIVEASLDGRYKKLHEAVAEVHVVDKDGNINSKQLSDVNVQEDIVVNVVMSPKQRESSGLVARWYSRKSVDTPLRDGFVSDLPDDVKVIIHKHGVFNDIPNVVVFVDGGRDLGLSKDEWNEVLVETPQELWYLQSTLSDSGGFEMLTATGVLDTSKINPSFADIVEVFKMRQRNLLVWLEKDQIRATFEPQYPPDIDDATSELFEFDAKVALTTAPSSQDKPELSKRMSKSEPTVNCGTKIEGFKGEIFDGERGQMQEKRHQYATSSYDNMMNPSLIAYPLDEDDVSLAIKYATLDEFEDARKTLANPSGRKYKVIGRGGGHQYCGVSCDNDALIISMENFNKTESYPNITSNDNGGLPKEVTGPDGKPHTVTRELHIGTGLKLQAVATFMNTDPRTGELAKGTNGHFGYTIPHGECPMVGIGGHSQSGGYGHIARAFGLAVDYIYGFTIVLADGEIRTVNRDMPDQADKDLYWAVLGGSPGAFGVTTNLVIHPILDEDYPESTAYVRAIQHSPEKMQATLDILEDFINRSHEGDNDALDEGIDLMVSLSSNVGNRLLPFLDQNKDNIIPNPDIILFELECRDKSVPKAAKQMDEIIKKFEKTVQWYPSPIDVIKLNMKWDGKRHKKLSEMSERFVRKTPTVTFDGRENRKPYRKMSYGSKDKLKPGWSKAFADLLNDVVATKDDISCVFQVVIGGGAQSRNGKANLNAIAHRDAQLHGLVFDLFRGDDNDSIKGAAEFSKRFELDVVNKHQTAYPKVMAQWASHGDLDMNKQHVWEKYFDKPETYHRLRQIKKEVDPTDVFHSRFSIRPAED